MKNIIITVLLCVSIGVFGQSEVINSLKVEKGNLLFSDDFERKEGLGDWTVHEKFNGAFTINKGKWVTKEIEGAGHGSTARVHFNYKDVVIEFDFKFRGAKRFNIVMDDMACKSVWAGHICRVSFSKNSFTVQDDKTGTMDLKIRNQIKDNPKKKLELKALLDSKKTVVKNTFEDNKWYHVIITKKGAVLECKVDGKIAQIKSEGINHLNLNKFGPTITGADILFDNINMWSIK
ncbi:DUF1080 domain-containing protein [Postechiella marina]|uniref:DUF1080 domain-containing protein n=1 Tax=Postechiella marina TaxID=943941 RepID=A0ABP8CDJ3_9FLAO